MARGLEICIAVLLFIVGLFTLFYPSLNGARLEKASVEAAESFIDTFIVPAEAAPEVTKPYAELYEAMAEYNEKIYAEKQQGLSAHQAYEEAGIDLSAYGFEDGVAAVLSIPAIELEMPVYLGASYRRRVPGFFTAIDAIQRMEQYDADPEESSATDGIERAGISISYKAEAVLHRRKGNVSHRETHFVQGAEASPYNKAQAVRKQRRRLARNTAIKQTVHKQNRRDSTLRKLKAAVEQTARNSARAALFAGGGLLLLLIPYCCCLARQGRCLEEVWT